VGCYSVKTTVEPTVEPVSLQEAKKHLRVPTSNEDVNIDRIYIPAARRQLEAELGRPFINTTYEYGLDSFPGQLMPILLPRNPVQSVTSITYIDTDGVEQTMDTSRYVLDLSSEPARVKPAYSEFWPSIRERTSGQTVKVTFVAGYGSAASDVPPGIKQAMLLLIGHYYYHREAVTPMNAKVLPRSVDNLIAAHRYGDEFIQYGGKY
jgi:uncharacterized phiE125 gp8 family phage protein